MAEKGLETQGNARTDARTYSSNVAVHNFDNRSDRYVIPHESCFWAFFPGCA